MIQWSIVAKTKQKTVKKTDDRYFLKLVICLILGFFWLRIVTLGSLQIPIPAGLIIGLVLVSKDKLKIDKKIEYAVLLVAMLVGFWAPVGLAIQV